MAVQAVHTCDASGLLQQGHVVGQGGAQVALKVHDARLCQLGNRAVRSAQQLQRAAQRHAGAVFAFNLACAHYHMFIRARHDVHAVAWVHQAHRARQYHAGRMQPKHFATHTAHWQLGAGSYAAHVKYMVEAVLTHLYAPLCLHLQHPRLHRHHCAAPMPLHTLSRSLRCQGVQGVMHLHMALAGQQPSQRGAVNAGL